VSELIARLSTIDALSVRFSYPWALLFLVLIPYTIYLGRQVRALSSSRKWIAIGLRCAVLLCLITALAGAELVMKDDRLAVFFLLDRSSSVPESRRSEAEQTVKTLCEAYMTPRDQAGIIAFGEEPSIERAIGSNSDFDALHSYVGGEQTDLAAAVRLALAAFPPGHMRRIVVFTDGNETRGSVLEEVKLAQASGASVDVVPITIGGENEIRIADVSAPARAKAGEPFRVQVNVHADQDGPATLRLYQKVREGTVMSPPTQVNLQKGANAFLLPQELSAPGFYEYEAIVESELDTVQANNIGRSHTVVLGDPSVLYLATNSEHGARLVETLRAEGINVTTADLGTMPSNLAQLQAFDAVLLDNIAATDLSSEQLRAMEAMVRDFGVGLVMVGGPDAYGAGGYFETPVERALPVSMDLKQRKVMPQGALVLIIDKSGSMSGQKIQLAKVAASAAVRLLSNADYVGIVAFDSISSWVAELQLASNRNNIIDSIETLGPGGGTDMYPSLVESYAALLEVNASLKHVVVLTDGQSHGGDFAGVLDAMAEESITVSTVAVGTDADINVLRAIAQKGGGRFYHAINPSDVPQIFTKEAAVVKRGMLIEEPFVPTISSSSELLQGIPAESIPQLLGYVATTPKENATIALTSHEGDPVLAQWRYGLGKSVAFTSDATSRWAPDWLAWDGFGRFWSQSVRWAMREISPSNFRVETQVKDAKGYVKIDAVDASGKFINFLKPKGTVTGPPPSYTREDVALTQTAPGIYEGTFPLRERGVYMINMTYATEEGAVGMVPAGLSLDYSKEFEYNTTNIPLLQQMAAVGGGRVVSPTDNPFEHDLPYSEAITPIWPYLAALGLCLFPVEIFVRRVMFSFAALFAWLLAVLRRLPLVGRVLPAPAIRRTQLTGAYGTMTAPSKSFVYVASGSFSMEGQLAAASAHASNGGAVAEGGEVTVQVEDVKAVGRTEYTRQLLQAKERALENRKRKR